MELGKRISELPKATPNNKNQDLEIDSSVDLAKPKSEAVGVKGTILKSTPLSKARLSNLSRKR